MTTAYVGPSTGIRVGSQVAIWWDIDRRYYEGTVDRIRRRKGCQKKYHVVYDDGDEEWCNLDEEDWYVVTEAKRLKWRQSSPPPTLRHHNDDVSCDEDVAGQRDDAEEWRELQDLSKRTMWPLKLDSETGRTASSADYDGECDDEKWEDQSNPTRRKAVAYDRPRIYGIGQSWNARSLAYDLRPTINEAPLY